MARRKDTKLDQLEKRVRTLAWINYIFLQKNTRSIVELFGVGDPRIRTWQNYPTARATPTLTTLKLAEKFCPGSIDVFNSGPDNKKLFDDMFGEIQSQKIGDVNFYNISRINEGAIDWLSADLCGKRFVTADMYDEFDNWFESDADISNIAIQEVLEVEVDQIKTLGQLIRLYRYSFVFADTVDWKIIDKCLYSIKSGLVRAEINQKLEDWGILCTLNQWLDELEFQRKKLYREIDQYKEANDLNPPPDI